MVDFLKQNKILIGVAVLIVIIFAWYTLSGTKEEAVLSSQAVAGSGQSVAEREVLNTLLELRAIKLEGRIFTNPVFQRLRDFTTEIVPEPVGRENPFAALGDEPVDQGEGGVSEGASQ